jgi:hypothetical protein
VESGFHDAPELGYNPFAPLKTDGYRQSPRQVMLRFLARLESSQSAFQAMPVRTACPCH